MSKKGRTPSRKKPVSAKKAPARANSSSGSTFLPSLQRKLNRDFPTSSGDVLMKKVFWVSFAVMVVLSIFIAFQTGINEDEKFHHGYEKVLMDFYASFGKDKAALNVETGKMHFYGGLFDVLTGLTNRIVGNTSPGEPGFHYVRHFFNALYGCVAILFTGLLARLGGGWRAGVLGLYFIFLSPRFLGHSMMNPRDIPFAAGYIMSLYFMVKLLKGMPKPDWKSVAGLAGGIMLAIGARAGGFLVIAYLGLFAILDFLLKFGLNNIGSNKNVLVSYIKYPAIAAIGGTFAALLFWPYGLVDPFTNVPKALTEFSNYSTNIRMLFGGELLWAQSLPLPQYIFTWLGQSIPLFSLVGLVLFVGFFRGILAKSPLTPLFVAGFALLFPILYILYKGSTLYDGMRHLLFVYTPLVVLAAISWNFLWEKFAHQKAGYYAISGILLLSLLEPAVFIGRNLPYFYVYVNPAAGGVKGAFGNYEQDYWGISVKQAVDWMEKEGILSSDLTDTLMVTSNFPYVTNKYAARFNGKVNTRYSRFRERYDKQWDYGIYVGRFIDPGQLNAGYWPSSKAIHTIKANGVPIAAIYKNTDSNAYLGYQTGKKGDWAGAIRYLEPEVRAFPDNDLAQMFLGNAYLNTGQPEKGEAALQKALEINPDNSQALGIFGNYLVSSGRVREARVIYERLIKVNESNYAAYYYLAAIELQENNLNLALDYGKKSIQYNQRFKQGYEIIATIFDKMGDSQSAAQYRAASRQIQ